MAIVPCDGADQGQVATLLLAMAREKGIPTGTIRVVWDGFEVPDELLATADRVVLSVPEPEARPETVDKNDDGAVTPELDDDADRILATAFATAPKRRGRPPGTKNATKTEVQKEV